MNYITKMLMPTLLVSMFFGRSMSAGSIEVVNKLSIALELTLGKGRNSIPVVILPSDVTRIPRTDVDSVTLGRGGIYKSGKPIKINNRVDSKCRITVLQDGIQVEEWVN